MNTTDTGRIAPVRAVVAALVQRFAKIFRSSRRIAPARAATTAPPPPCN